MKKFQWLKRSVWLLLVIVGMLGAIQVSAAEPEVYTVSAPEKDLKIQFWLSDGVPYYNVESEGKILVEDAKLGLNTSLGAWKDGFTLKSTSSSSDDTTWEPVVGEQDVIRDCYNETKFVLTQESGIELGIVMRAYDEGVALRYELPATDETYTVTDEYTQFTFPAGTYANAHVGGNQTVPSRMAVESFTGSTMQRPMTLQFTDGQLMTVCEANLDHYDTMVLKKDSSKARTVKAAYGGSNTITAEGPYATPWRALVIGKDETDLAANATLVMNLNEAPDEETYGFSEWVEAGSCLRATSGMNNAAIKDIVDQAQENGIKYVLLDTGWYGPENDANCDPRLDPTKLDLNNAKDKFLMDNYFATEGGYNNTGEGVFDTKGHGFSKYGSLGQSGDFNTEVDIPMLCSYANERGVGIILYVNGVLLPDRSGRNRFTTDELFSYFEKWGVKGVKPGFVKVRSQSNETYLEEQVIKSAAKHKLVMTIHDEYVASGLERTYPNLMQEEGILGDEGIGKSNPQVDKDIATLFTRTIQGPADHTFCYPGKGTKAYALASPIMFRAGMSLLYWYTNPNSIPEQDQSKVGIWKDFPGTWSKTLYLEGKMYQYATYARKTKEGVWYVGSLSAVDRTLEVPLDFLDEDTWYVADVYADGTDANPYAGWNSAAKEAQILENEKYLVNSSTVLQRKLKYGYGYAVRLTKATESDLQTYKEYNHCREELKYTLEGAKLLDKGTYTEESWQKLQDAMATAEALLADDQAEDEAMQAAILALTDAKEHLCSMKDFNAAMKKASLYTKHQFTSASWKELEDAVAAAEELLKGSITQKDLDAATDAVNAAIAGLQRRENLQVDKTLYLSDLDYNEEKSTFIRAERFHKDKNRAEGTLTLMINGKKTEFERGVGMDAWSNVYYDIEGLGYETFEAYVGVDAAKPSQGNIIFRVYGDGALLYESKASGTGSQNAQFISVPVAGVKELYLESDMNGTDNGDWADWADAKFLTYQDPEPALEGIRIDGKYLEGFSQDVYEYYYPVEEGDAVPKLEALLSNDEMEYTVANASRLPGDAVIHVTKDDGTQLTYKVMFRYLKLADYLSDLDHNAEKSNFIRGTVHKDKNRADGTLTLMIGGVKTTFERGVGMDAWANVYYDIEGLGYETFEAYVGVDAAKPVQGNIIFRVYGDGVLLYESKASGTGSQNAQFISIPVAGVKELYLQSDMNGNDNGDWADWADAKFLSYENSYTTQLNRVIAMIEGLDASEYTADSWAAVEEALAAAKAVAADRNAAQSQIDTAMSDLIGAFGNLEYGVQKLHLEVAIEAAEKILALGKNYEDIDALTEAVQSGKEILADEKATQEEVNNAAYAILDELFQMAKTADISSLESLIEAAKGLLDEKYTSGSLENLKDAIDAAEAVVADQNRGDSDISDAYANLIDAIIKLEMKGNKAALKAMLIKANEVLAEADAYVAETIEGLAEVTEEAQAVYDNEDALQSEVNEAVKALTLKVAEARLLGDVDGDGAVTTADSAAVLRSAAELDTLSAEAAASADVNGDGAADTSDAVMILQYAAEEIAAF
ncbi:MAG: NPCBM/NEW2 domain-containing protein [Hominisplanchenecus sp.]